MIRVEDLEKHFGPLHVLRGISLEVQKGEVLVIIGPSGSGKSTLLRCINLLIEPDSGRVFLDGVQVNRRDIRPEWVRQQVGMVFQSFNLFAHLTALENVTLGPIRVLGNDPKVAEAEGRKLQSLKPILESTLRGAATASCNRPCPRDEPQSDAVR